MTLILRRGDANYVKCSRTSDERVDAAWGKEGKGERRGKEARPTEDGKGGRCAMKHTEDCCFW